MTAGSEAALEPGDEVPTRTAERKPFASTDPLTGLADRGVLFDRLDDLAQRPAERGNAAVLVIDLDSFRSINNTYGHAIGDDLLVEVARRVTTVLGAGDTAARLGADEFAILLETADGQRAAVTAERVLAELREPVGLNGRQVLVQASVGVAVSGPATRPADLLRHADAAKYFAKAQGKGQYRIFDPVAHEATLSRLRLGADLGGALLHGRIEPHYQPIVELRTGRVVGFEALARWQRDDGSSVAPTDFIDVAEERGMIMDVGKRMLEHACAQLHAWDELDPHVKIGVNLSTRQLSHPELVDLVESVLAQNGVEPTRLTLEVTESGLVEGEGFVATLHRLAALGVNLAIDDFGTGYSSLSYLRRLPVNCVKIDRSLVEGVDADADQWTLLRAIVRLLRTLGLLSVAEGVERAEQMLHLRSLGCDQAQGYHYSRALPAGEATALLGARLVGARRHLA